MMYSQVYDPMINEVSKTVIQRDEDGAFIPIDLDNTDYQMFVEWQKNGGMISPPKGTPTPPVEEIPAPDIREVNAQVQDIEQRLSDLEGQVSNVQDATVAFRKALTTDSGEKNG